MHRINLLFLYFLIFYAAYAHGQTSSAKPIKLRPADEALQPVVSYLSGLDLLKDSSLVRGPYRILRMKGRTGIHAASIHTRLVFPEHTLRQPRGTLVMWVAALEDIAAAYAGDNMGMHNPHYRHFPLLSDLVTPQNMTKAHFGIFYTNNWHPQFYAKFFEGDIYPHSITPPQKALITANAFEFHRDRWYCITLSWDKVAEKLNLYANGIRIGTEDQNHDAFHIDPVGDTLFAGTPALCYSQLSFYDQVLSPEQVYDLYKEQVTDYDADFEAHLRYVYEGKDRQKKKFNWRPGKDWQPKLSLSLTKPTDLDSFYVQGYTQAPEINSDGLLVETPNLPQSPANLEKQVYLWTQETFEGDLYVEYEFKILRPGGLSLLMVQASGMNREDFMKDYPLRTTGNMRMVHREDVRNYHWEYYREMNDVRNDIACGALAKNPYLYPLSFGCVDHLFKKDTWHKLQFLQRGDSLIGAIDGIVMVEAKDSAFINNGSVYNYGHIAIRCMIRTKMMFRNLKIYNHNQAFEVQFIQE